MRKVLGRIPPLIGWTFVTLLFTAILLALSVFVFSVGWLLYDQDPDKFISFIALCVIAACLAGAINLVLRLRKFLGGN